MQQTFLTNFTRKSTPEIIGMNHPLVSKAFLRLALPLLFLSLFVQTTFGQHIFDDYFAKAIRDNCLICIDRDNNLTAKAKSLKFLNVSGKNISNLSGLVGFTSLEVLHCDRNQLTSIYELPASLRTLVCNNNKLTSLPNLKNLINLGCDYNQLTSLPTLPSNLRTLVCNINPITCLPTLPNTLVTLKIDHGRINCLPNNVTGLSVYDWMDRIVRLPVCSTIVTTHPSISSSVCKDSSVTLTAKATTNGSTTVHWERKVENGVYTIIPNTTKAYTSNTNDNYVFTVAGDNLSVSFRAVFTSCNATTLTRQAILNKNNALATPTVTVVQPTCANGGSITITNLATNNSSQLNNDSITVGKTVYPGLSAGTYKVSVSNLVCTSSTTVNLTQSLGIDPNKCYRLVNRNSGLVLDILSASLSSGYRAIQTSLNTSSNQNWGFTALAGNKSYFRVTSKRSNLSLHARSFGENSRAFQAAYLPDSTSDWRVTCVGNGYFRLQHRASGMYLGILSNATQAGRAVVIQTLDAANLAQQWQIVEATCLSTQNLTTNAVSNITASAEAGRNRIQFLTNQGFRTDYFEIEKQNVTTGDFEKLVLFNNTQPDEAMQIHTMYDNKPDNGESHYRLKTTYLSGDFDYSAIQTVKRSASSVFTISPNPATDEAFIDLKTFENHAITLTISDLSGKNLFIEQLKSATAAPHRLDVSALQTGLYFVKIQAQGKRELTHKLQVTR